MNHHQPLWTTVPRRPLWAVSAIPPQLQPHQASAQLTIQQPQVIIQQVKTGTLVNIQHIMPVYYGETPWPPMTPMQPPCSPPLTPSPACMASMQPPAWPRQLTGQRPVTRCQAPTKCTPPTWTACPWPTMPPLELSLDIWDNLDSNKKWLVCGLIKICPHPGNRATKFLARCMKLSLIWLLNMSEAPKWPIIPAFGRIVPAKADLLKPNTSWSITFECIRGKNPFRVRFPGVAKFLLDRRISRYTKESIQVSKISNLSYSLWSFCCILVSRECENDFTIATLLSESLRAEKLNQTVNFEKQNYQSYRKFLN